MEQVIRRQDLVEADLRCLMCGRLIGRLAGLVWRDAGAQRGTGTAVSLTAFRPSGPGQPSVPLTGRDRFRCEHCGGMAVMEEISVSRVHDAPSTGNCPVHRDRVVGRGRRPRGCQCTELRRAA